MGEFCNILKKVVRGDFPLNSAKAEMNEELADIFIYLIKISNQFDVDLETESSFIKELDKSSAFCLIDS
jgi:NTP pyrophosphatase (non-canonical NTP hydrolase)